MKKPIPSLSLFDAVNIALGAIIGAGIFVILGSAAGVAGPAVFLSILIAAAVALLTGVASAELSKLFPRSGGAYLFAKEAISDSAGFIVGWVWLFSNIVTGATVAVGFGHYLAFFLPQIPVNAGAASAVISLTAINLLGMKESSKVNNALVALKILVLLFFVASAFFFFKPSNFQPIAPFGITGILAGAATIFFAYGGFARVAVIADEIKNPAVNVPRATILSILISTAIYLLVAIAAVGISGYQLLGSSGSPLADAMSIEHLAFGALLVAFGALVATSTVAFSSVLGLSRLASTMAENHELPAFISKLDSNGIPRNAVLLSGLAMLASALFTDLLSIAYISSFSLLLYYAAINLSGLKIFKNRTRYFAFFGFLSCLLLMFSLPAFSWFIGLGAVALGIVYYLLFVRRGRKTVS